MIYGYGAGLGCQRCHGSSADYLAYLLPSPPLTRAKLCQCVEYQAPSLPSGPMINHRSPVMAFAIILQLRVVDSPSEIDSLITDKADRGQEDSSY